MKKEMSREIKFGKGRAVVTIALKNKSIESDWGSIESSEIEKEVKIEIVSNGKVITTQSHVTLIENNELYSKYMTQQGMNLNKKYSRVGKIATEGEEAYNNIKNAIKKMEEELAQELEVKTEKEVKQEIKIEEAQEIVKKAGKEGIENLMTEKQLMIWIENYNRIHNEGGEGYIPVMVSKEQYSKALEVIN